MDKGPGGPFGPLGAYPPKAMCVVCDLLKYSVFGPGSMS
jgi:hypothetical protein